VSRAGVKPGDTVAVLGVGGVGMSAVQGARVAGARRIIAVDPVEFKREQALRFGATHVYASLDEAIAGVGQLTWGEMCDSVICTFGVMLGELLEPALTLTAKGGTCVVTSVAPIAQGSADVNLFLLAMMNKQIKGCLYGAESPRIQIPRLLGLYRDGQLKIDEMITQTYSLDQVNDGYADIAAGRVVRGAIIF
jgi:S-(hydroxymethyl)glutathione dehydrogenase/alcohol dehydrogenase